ARYAAGPQAVAARPAAVALDQHDARPEARRRASGHESRGAAADDYEVVPIYCPRASHAAEPNRGRAVVAGLARPAAGRGIPAGCVAALLRRLLPPGARRAGAAAGARRAVARMGTRG